MDLKDFGEYFTEIRIREGYKSQRSLAEKSGISYSTISRIELGTHKANPETLRELANCFSTVSYEELLQNCGYIDIETIIREEKEGMLYDRLFKLDGRYDNIQEKLYLTKIYVRKERLLNYFKFKKISLESVASNLFDMTLMELINILDSKKSITFENSLLLAKFYKFKYSDMFEIQRAFYIGRQLPFNETELLSEIDETIRQEINLIREKNVINEVLAEYAISIEDEFVKLPIYGEIKAGYGMVGEENIIGYQMESKSRVEDGEYFYLLVKGDSMIEDGIIDGCRVLVRKQSTVPNGKIGVIIINSEEATLKRVFYDGDKVILQASNKSIPPKTYDISEVLIQGQVKSFVVDI